MNLLFLLNISLFFILSFSKVYIYTKAYRLSFINPISIVFFCGMPMLIMQVLIGPIKLIDNGILDEAFNFAILMSSLSLLCEALLILFLFKFFKNSKIVNRLINKFSAIKNINQRKLLITSILFYCFFLICFIVVSSSSFGIVNWIIDPRQGYQLYRTGYGVFYAFSYLFLSTSCVLFTLYAKRISTVYIASIVFFGSAYLLGSKGYILAIFVYYLILLGIRKRSHLYKFSVVGVIIVIPMLLINFGSADLSDIASYFDFYPNSAMYYREYFANKIDLFYGEIWFSDFYSWVPRSIFPDKPYVYGLLHVNEYFFPGAVEATNVAAFAGPVAAFADFGVLGVIFFGFMNVQVFFNFLLFQVLFRDYDENNIRNKSDRLYVFIYLFAPLYLAFFNFLLGLIVYMIVISSISFLNRLRLV